MPGKAGCYSWYQSETLFGDLRIVDSLEIVEQISRNEMIGIEGIHLSIKGYKLKSLRRMIG